MSVSLQKKRRGSVSLATCLARASAVVAVGMLAQSASAQIVWDSGGGADQNWSNPANWNTNTGLDQEPGPGDSAVLNNGGTIVINQTGEACNRFQVGRSNYALSPANSANLGLAGTVNILPGGELIDSGAFDMGTYTVGGPQAATTNNILNVSGGNLYTGEFLRLAPGVGSGATVNLTSGLIDVAQQFPGTTSGQVYIGDHGVGVFNMVGGTLTVRNQITVGLNTVANGTFNISGGTVNNTNDFVVANLDAPIVNGVAQANALVTQTGGAITSTGRYSIGFFANSIGVSNHSAGTAVVGQLEVGRFGNGVMTLSGTSDFDSGSTTFIGGHNLLNNTVAPTGTMSISGSAKLTTGGLILGQGGDGTLNLSSGTVNVLGTVRHGGNSETNGDGSVFHLLVGRDGGGDIATGNGVVNHTGGAMNVSTDMFLGDFDDSNGTYNLSGGTLAIAGNVHIGGALASNTPPDATRAGTDGQALGAKGTLHVIGNAATITVGGNFLANPADRTRVGTANQATLAFDIGSDAGTSLINVAGVADIDGAAVNLTLSGTTYVPAYHKTYTLLTASSFGATGTGTTQNTGTGSGYVLSGANATDWTLAIVTANGKQSLVATNQIVPGDANNDKVVNFDDLVKLAQNYNQLSGKTRAQGDFNRTGGVNFDDLVILAQNYNQNFSAQMLSELNAISPNFGGDWALAQSLVPEPTTLGLLGAAATLVTRRRRETSR